MASYSNNRHTVRHQRDLDQINCCGSFSRQKFGYRVTGVEVIQSDENLATAHTVNPKYSRASDRLWRKKSNFVEFLGTNSWKNWPISWKFLGETSPSSNQ